MAPMPNEMAGGSSEAAGGSMAPMLNEMAGGSMPPDDAGGSMP